MGAPARAETAGRAPDAGPTAKGAEASFVARLRCLTARQRLALVAHDVCGLPADHAADMTGLELAAFSRLLWKARVTAARAGSAPPR